MQWLLYLSCEDEPEIVVLATKVLARLLIVHGSSYSKKFSDKNGGYTVLENHLQKWWNVPALWPICFSILFGQDLAAIDLDRQFTASNLLGIFLANGDLRIAFPEMLPVIMGMVKRAIESLVSPEREPDPNQIRSDSALEILMSAHSLGCRCSWLA